MEYYLTKNATAFRNEFEEAVKIVDRQIQEGFSAILFPKIENAPLEIYRKFDLPIFFVAEADLGHQVGSQGLEIVTNRLFFDPYSHEFSFPYFPIVLPLPHYSRSYGFTFDLNRYERQSHALNNPSNIRIPTISEFKYSKVEFPPNSLEDVDIKDIQREFWPPEDGFVSSDWLGLYCTYDCQYRCIFIRVEEILNSTSINNPLGIASVILHELGHALLDILRSNRLQFKNPSSEKVQVLISYYIEEAMANLFAFTALKSGRWNKNTLKAISDFMQNQPFPYALGVKLAIARSITDYYIQSYLSKWYKAKCGIICIDDWETWLKQVQASNFTINNIKQQYSTLFSKIQKIE